MKKNFILGVIASLLASLIFELFTNFQPWTLIWQLIQYLVSLLAYQIVLPVWALLILITLTLPTLFVLVLLIKLRSKSVETFYWLNYVSDNIFDIRWVWRRYGDDISSLTALCPQCLNELTPSNGLLHGIRSYPESLICDHCGFRRDFGISIGEIVNKVKKEIRRRLRTREFFNKPITTNASS